MKPVATTVLPASRSGWIRWSTRSRVLARSGRAEPWRPSVAMIESQKTASASTPRSRKVAAIMVAKHFSPVETIRSERRSVTRPSVWTSSSEASSMFWTSLTTFQASFRCNEEEIPFRISSCLRWIRATASVRMVESCRAAARAASSNAFVTPDAADTTTTRGAGWARAIWAASRTRSALATDVPPNLRTIMRALLGQASGPLSGRGGCWEWAVERCWIMAGGSVVHHVQAPLPAGGCE
jgi:hypothetical protein